MCYGYGLFQLFIPYKKSTGYKIKETPLKEPIAPRVGISPYYRNKK